MCTRNLFYLILPLSALYTSCGQPLRSEVRETLASSGDTVIVPASAKPKTSILDTAAYVTRMKYVTNGDASGKWPAHAPLPRPGAILPFRRVVAFYGNLYSRRMGILGELPRQQMLAKLKQEVAAWEKADPASPVQPALHYIAVTAQGSPGAAGKYRLRMPFSQIDTILKWAEEINAIVFLDIQVGLGSLKEELPQLEAYLKKPNVHIGIDPEFSMKGGQAPGKVIGTFDASDINYVVDQLSRIVRDNDLPPKILVVHRFTRGMVTHVKDIRKSPEVQIVMHMDGWGEPAKKLGTYRQFIYGEPVQFTGFKIFYKNDLKNPPHRLLTPGELVRLRPMPMYIQYQ